MTTATHVHKFEVDSKDKGSCKCERIRQFFPNEKNHPPQVLAIGLLPAAPSYEIVQKPVQADAKVDRSVDPAHADPPVPAKPKGSKALKKYYDLHKDAIMADVKLLGVNKTREKWGISSGSFPRMRRSWGMTIGKHTPHKKPDPKPPASETKPEKNDPPKANIEPEKLYVETVSPIGLEMINRLIDFWNSLKDSGVTISGREHNLAIDQTIDCLEALAGIEREDR